MPAAITPTTNPVRKGRALTNLPNSPQSARPERQVDGALGYIVMKALLISTYDLGHQPLGLASPAAWLREAGADVHCLDLAVEEFDEHAVIGADLVAIHVPMHTATRLAEMTISRIRQVNPTAQLCCFGLYAPMNADWLQKLGVQYVIGGEYEQPLTDIYRSLGCNTPAASTPVQISLEKQNFRLPDRRELPSLDQYAQLIWPDGRRGLVGYTEGSRGCKHLCRHCPVVPVYNGRFRVIQRDIVMADIHQLVAHGAEHITFGDPDFFNGPGHALALVRMLHEEFPDLTYDVVIKIEHLIAQADKIPVLKETGCLFVTTAVESVEDRILSLLDKGHTRADFIEAAELCRTHALDLSPTFIPFTPWTTSQGYVDLLATVHELGLVDSLSPIQLAIRLLVPNGSRLLELDEWREHEGVFDESALSFRWTHPDPAVEHLYTTVRDLVSAGEVSEMSRREIFSDIWQAAHDSISLQSPSLMFEKTHPTQPRMSEAWYCCAEPSDLQLARM